MAQVESAAGGAHPEGKGDRRGPHGSSTRTSEPERTVADDPWDATEESYRICVVNATDAISVNVGGERVFVNPAFLTLFGLQDISEAVGSSVSQFVVPEDREALLEYMAAAERGDPVSLFHEYRIQRPGGETRTLEASGTSIEYQQQPGCLAVLRDITDRKHAEREVALRTAELTAVFNVAKIFAELGSFNEQVTKALDELCLIGDADSAHLRVPDEEQQGLRLVAAVGMGAQDYPVGGVSPFSERGRSVLAYAQGEPITGGAPATPSAQGEGRARTASGGHSALWLPARAMGRTVGVIAVGSPKAGHFTPERVRLLGAIADGIGSFLASANFREAARLHGEEVATALEQLKSTQQQLIQSEKLAAVGTLIAGVAHEINNPLGNIRALVDLSLQEDLDETLKRDLQTIGAEGERAIRIVRNLLSFTREHKPETTLVSLNDALDQVLELRAYELEVSNIELRKDFATNLPEIPADLHQLQQVFLNLVINAEQAMTAAHDRGVLSLTTKRVGEFLHVVVTDDGPGIPTKNLSKVFDPFFTTKEVGAGTGLGLSVCYGIIQGHGGQLRVSSEEGRGTTFVVELPVRNVD